jgi:hypothetical protein
VRYLIAYECPVSNQNLFLCQLLDYSMLVNMYIMYAISCFLRNQKLDIKYVVTVNHIYLTGDTSLLHALE